MKKGDNILNIIDGKTYIIDEIYSVDNITVIFTMDGKCYPISNFKLPNKNKKQYTLNDLKKSNVVNKVSKSFLSINEKEKISNQIKKEINKELGYEKYSTSSSVGNTNTSWLRKILSHLS